MIDDRSHERKKDAFGELIDKLFSQRAERRRAEPTTAFVATRYHSTNQTLAQQTTPRYRVLPCTSTLSTISRNRPNPPDGMLKLQINLQRSSVSTSTLTDDAYSDLSEFAPLEIQTQTKKEERASQRRQRLVSPLPLMYFKSVVQGREKMHESTLLLPNITLKEVIFAQNYNKISIGWSVGRATKKRNRQFDIITRV